MVNPQTALVSLVGDGLMVPCVDGRQRPYLNLDSAASTSSLEAVAQKVQEFLPWYSSVHRGAGYKSRLATVAYEKARFAAMSFAGRDIDGGDVAIVCRNTTEAINHLAYRLNLSSEDVVVTTVVEHHANLLPWARLCKRRFVECDADGTFDLGAVEEALAQAPRPQLFTVTGASNVTGWLPPLDALIETVHARGVPILIDAAQLAPHRPLPAGADYLAWSGHKMYAPFGAGILLGPRASFTDGDPFLAGGGAVDLVDLEEVSWTEPPEREEAGSPNVIGAVALDTAIGELTRLGWDQIVDHDDRLAGHLRHGLAAIPGVSVLGPSLLEPTLPIAAFTVEGSPHALVAARLSAEYGIGIRHGCFCAHPYLMRLLELDATAVTAYRKAVLAGDHRNIPGAVRASAGLNTSISDIDRLLSAVAEIASGEKPPVTYTQDPATGDYWPEGEIPGWTGADRSVGASCARG